MFFGAIMYTMYTATTRMYVLVSEMGNNYFRELLITITVILNDNN